MFKKPISWQSLIDLSSVTHGFYRLKNGFADIRIEKDGNIGLTWMNGIYEHHWSFYDDDMRPKSITFNTEGALISYFETAISPLLKWGYGRGTESDLLNAYEFAHDMHYKICEKKEFTYYRVVDELSQALKSKKN